MADQKSDNNGGEEEIAEIIAESPPEVSKKTRKPKKEGAINQLMDRIASLIFKAVIFGVIAGGVGVGIILVVPQQFLPNSPSPEIPDGSTEIEESIAGINVEVEKIKSAVIPALEVRIDSLEGGVSQLVTELNATNNQGSSLSSELISIKGTVETQSEQLSKFGRGLDDLAIKNEVFRDEFEKALIPLEESLFDIAMALEAVEAENRNLQEDFSNLRFSTPMISSSGVVEMAEETGIPIVETTETNSMVGVNGQLIMLEARLQRIGEKIQEVDTLSRNLEDMGEEISDLQLELASISSGHGLVSELGSDIQRLNTQSSHLKDELNNLNEQNQTLEDRVTGLQENTARMEMQLTTLSSLAVGENSLRNLTLVGIQAAVEAGIPYAAIIGDIETNRLELPPIILELSDDGVATLAELQNEFEALITEALKAVETGAEGGSIQDTARSIVTSLVQVRSLTPREGDDAVAVLSRLEESLNQGDLESVLQLYAQLPPPVQETLALWILKVQNRLDLKLALETSLSKPVPQTGP